MNLALIKTSEAATVVLSILCVQKPRHREANQFAQHHMWETNGITTELSHLALVLYEQCSKTSFPPLPL